MSKSDIKNAGLKVTIPRLKILELLENSEERHLKPKISIEACTKPTTMFLATVYRVLTQFEQAGLVTRHHLKVVMRYSRSMMVSIMITW